MAKLLFVLALIACAANAPAQLSIAQCAAPPRTLLCDSPAASVLLVSQRGYRSPLKFECTQTAQGDWAWALHVPRDVFEEAAWLKEGGIR